MIKLKHFLPLQKNIPAYIFRSGANIVIFTAKQNTPAYFLRKKILNIYRILESAAALFGTPERTQTRPSDRKQSRDLIPSRPTPVVLPSHLPLHRHSTLRAAHQLSTARRSTLHLLRQTAVPLPHARERT